MPRLADCAGMAREARIQAAQGQAESLSNPIGFHDAYVATEPQGRSCSVGNDKDLFASGVAKEVNDPALMEEPLSAPGMVFRQMRAMPLAEPQATPRKAIKRKAPYSTAAKHSM
jgi:hypothetical protein